MLAMLQDVSVLSTPRRHQQATEYSGRSESPMLGSVYPRTPTLAFSAYVGFQLRSTAIGLAQTGETWADAGWEEQADKHRCVIISRFELRCL